jgi:hypothetical protein
LRWCDLDFDRRVVSVWQGKGRADRQVTLPVSYESLLRALAAEAASDDFLFPGAGRDRHISPRTIERVEERTVRGWFFSVALVCMFATSLASFTSPWNAGFSGSWMTFLDDPGERVPKLIETWPMGR